ncbi:MAG: 50S ribosomal protein L32 [Planctomycetota bacterium]|nr:50S ribosomal protein L32 [Planctomycetota bacterium]MEE2737888.1 50S ribosomal protein L32 [Planctomycetota bacterium]
MAVPRRRHSRARTRKRRSHHAMKSPALHDCPQCQQPTPPHHICIHCGTYRGRTVAIEEED